MTFSLSKLVVLGKITLSLAILALVVTIFPSHTSQTYATDCTWVDPTNPASIDGFLMRDGLLSYSQDGGYGDFAADTTNRNKAYCIDTTRAAIPQFSIPTFLDMKTSYFDLFKDDPANPSKVPEIIGPVTTGATFSPPAGRERLYYVTGANSMPTEVTISAASPITIDSAPNTLAVVFINGNLTLETNLTHNNQFGGLVFVVSGDVRVRPAVDRIDAAMVVFGQYCDAWTGVCPADDQIANTLVVNGAVIALSELDGLKPQFKRTLSTGNSQPAERFNFETKYLVLLKKFFAKTRYVWTELTQEEEFDASVVFPTPTPTNTPTPSNTPTPIPPTPTPTPITDGTLASCPAGSINLNSHDNSGRGCGDAASFSVTNISPNNATLNTTPSANCLKNGDQILLINLQGTSGSNCNVGNYEFLTVNSVSGNIVNFQSSKTRLYGDCGGDGNIGTGRSNQRVILQRVPKYNTVNIPGGCTLTADAWDGVKGGVLALTSTGEVVNGGAIDMTKKGYLGGVSVLSCNPHGGGDFNYARGWQGESYTGLGIGGPSARYASPPSTSPNFGAGGSGWSSWPDCSPGGGGAHVGGGGWSNGDSSGDRDGWASGGTAYTAQGDISKLYFGSGGGSGSSYDSHRGTPSGGELTYNGFREYRDGDSDDGTSDCDRGYEGWIGTPGSGRGGGIVYIQAPKITNNGLITVRGNVGANAGRSACQADGDDGGGYIISCDGGSAGGGGGAGGSLILRTPDFPASGWAGIDYFGGAGSTKAYGTGGAGGTGKIYVGN